MSRDPEIAFLQRLALTAAAAGSMGELVRLVISETTEALGTDVCSVYLLDPDDGRLVLTATNGLSHAGVGTVRLAPGEGVTGAAAAERAPVVVPDVRREPRFRWLDGVDQARFVAMCSVPIVAADRLVGVLNVQTDHPRDFGDADVRFLSAIAAQVAGVLARVELQERLERRVAELARSEEVHRRLSDLVLTGAGLDGVCGEIARLAGSALAVYDPAGEPLARSGDGLPERLHGGGPAGRDVHVTPLRAGPETLGWLAVGPPSADADAGRRQALDHGATVLALELVRERAAAEAEERLHGDLLDELLSSPLSPDEADRLAERAARLGRPLGAAAWVILVEGDDARAGHALAAPSVRARAERELAALAGRRGAALLVVERAGGLALLVADLPDAAAAEARAAEAREVACALAREPSVSCGISGGAGAPAHLHRLADEARQALRAARRLGGRATVASYRRLGVERLLMAVEPPGRLAEFADDWIGPLMRHGDGGRGAAPLLATLEALVATGWNMRGAARRLGVHVNTLLYRAGRIEALIGRELDDPEVRLALALALRARLVAGAPGAAGGQAPTAVRSARERDGASAPASA